MKFSYSRQIILFIFLSFAWSLQSFGQQTTVNFNGYTENQGLSNPHVEGELRFEAIKGTSATCTVCVGIDINEGNNGGPGLDDSNQEIGGIIGWKISRADDASFQFLSIWLQDRDISNTLGTSDAGTIKAYKEGAQVGSTKAINFDSGTSGLKSFATDPDFFDVDYVLIEGVDLFLILDEVTFNVPFIDGSDTPPTVLAINLVGAPLSTAESVTFNVEFSKIAKNVSIDDFELTKTGTATGTIASVSGSNATYSVLVTGLSGEGTIRLDIKAGTDISNENNITGTAAFTSGQIHNVSPCLIEDFEDETDASKTFSHGGNNFSITGNLEVHTEAPPIGINGSRYVLLNTGSGPYVINSLSSDIILKKFAVYLSSDAAGTKPTNDGSITVVGKNDGSQVYSITKSSGFPEDFSANSGYYIFDLSTEGGADNSTEFIDQVEISLGGAFQYINVDNFEFCLDVPPVGLSLSAIKVDETCPGRNGSIDLTISDATGTPIISWTGPDTFTASVEDLNNLVAGLYTVEVRDDTGTTETLEVEILLAPDTEAPIITDIAPISVGNDPGMCSASVEFSATVSDNCDTDLNPIFTLDNGTVITSGYAFSVGETTVMVNATDAAGNQAIEKSFVVTVKDTEAPILIGQNAIFELDATGNFILYAEIIRDKIFTSESDNCGLTGVIFISPNDAFFDCSDIGTHTITFTIGDRNGNSAQTTVDITITDPLGVCNQPPVAVTKPLTVSADANCEGSATDVDFDGGSTDADGDQLSFSVSPVGPYPLGVTNVTLMVTDSKGASSTATTTVTVKDDTAPVPPPAPEDLKLQCANEVPPPMDLTATDNCGDITVSPTIIYYSDEYPLGSSDLDLLNLNDIFRGSFEEVRTWTFTDPSGNTASVSQNIRVEDTTPPIAPPVPADVTVECEDDVPAPVDLTFTDNCDDGTTDISPIITKTYDANGVDFTEVRTWTFTDPSGNTTSVSQNIRVEDTSPPVLVLQDVTVIIDPDGTANGNALNNGAIVQLSDNCGIKSVGGTGSSTYTCGDLGSFTVTVTAFDFVGNATTRTYVLTIIDPNNVCNVAPVAVAKPLMVSADANCEGMATAIEFDGGSTDANGDPLTFSISPAGPYALGVTNVTLSVSDGLETSQAMTTITVKDDTAPVVTVITPTPTAVLGLTNTVTLQATDIFAATDNCSGDLVFSPTVFTFDCDNLGENIVSVSVTDAAGNIANANATVTISDNVALSIDASESGTPVPLGSDAVLKATVSPAAEGVEVTFLLDGFTKGTAITDGFGVATLVIPATELGSLPVVYKVSATIVECTGLVESVAYLPIFDPNGNFVTGGGWIMSPVGAYKADESLTGKANFGFVSKYKKGSSQVDGNTEFQFKAGDLNFKSTLHESGTLVISGKKATYRGEGTINDVPGYRFTLVALDGNWNGGSDPDQFRIKVWGESGIIYDNGLGADDNSDASTVLGGGSITIHQAKGKGPKRILTDLVEVPWNTPTEVIEKKIASMSADWFDGKNIKLKINTDSYNSLLPGFYELKTELMENEWFALDEPITVNVLVADKPLATDIILSNSILLRNINAGTVIGNLSTIDPVDDQHTYTIAEQSDFELVGRSLIWRGTTIPSNSILTVFSTDRAGQTIERSIKLTREPRFGDFNMFPNPAESDVTIEVELEQSMNVGIRIYDAVGKLVHEQEGVQDGTTSYKIAIDNLSPGLYTVQVKTGQIVMNKRLIKK